MEAKSPYFAVLAVQAIFAGVFLFSKAAFNEGMSTYVFVFYRQATAAVVLTPFALCFEWKNSPPLSFVVLCKIFLLSLFGITLPLNMACVALMYTTASLGAAISNSFPVLTFFIALLLRMEKVKLRSASGIATTAGIVFFLAGSVTIGLYRGPHLKFLPHHHLFGHTPLSSKPEAQFPSSHKWITGCLVLLLSNIFWASWLLFQGMVMKSYPPRLLFTTLQSLFSSVQCFVVAISVERNLHQWKLGWNIRLFSVLYCGIMVASVAFALQTWVIQKKGGVFFAMATPLSYIITTFFSSLLLGEIITLGSVLGGILLIGGLYSVLWGESVELKIANNGIDLPFQAEQQTTASSIKAARDNTKAVLV